MAFVSYKFYTVRLPGWLNALFFQCRLSESAVLTAVNIKGLRPGGLRPKNNRPLRVTHMLLTAQARLEQRQQANQGHAHASHCAGTLKIVTTGHATKAQIF